MELCRPPVLMLTEAPAVASAVGPTCEGITFPDLKQPDSSSLLLTSQEGR